jgi:acyl-CoA reductase-like NAD-dependent aldehyde dehydrogenase
VGTVPKATLAQVRPAFAAAMPTRPAEPLRARQHPEQGAAQAVRERTAEIAALITAEAACA